MTPLQLHIRDASFNEQKDGLLNLVHDQQEVFFLEDRDLGLCDKLAHTVLTMSDKPVYLSHRMISYQS